MGIFYIIFNRMPAIGCAMLASGSLALSFGVFRTCQFVKVSYSAHNPEDGFLISDGDEIQESDEYIYDRYNIGLFCPSSAYTRDNDMMWNLARYFLIAAFALMGMSLILAWGVATIMKPTHRNWKALSVVSIMTAGLQIPVFLFFTIKPCQSGERECKAGQGFFMLLWSVMLLTILTITTLCFNYPEWREIEESWKVQEREHPLYDDYEDSSNTFDFDGINSPVAEEKQKMRGDNKVGEYADVAAITAYPYPTQELNVNRRRKKLKKKRDEDGNFYQLQDKDERVSQCLSGMSSELPLGLDHEDFDMEEQDEDESGEEYPLPGLVKREIEVSDALKPPSVTPVETDERDEVEMHSITHNEQWGENIRNRTRALSDGAIETNVSPSRRSPKRWPFGKKANENVGYIFLTEDDEDVVSHLVFDEDGESDVYNIDTIRIHSSSIMAERQIPDAHSSQSTANGNDRRINYEITRHDNKVQRFDEERLDADVNTSKYADSSESDFQDCDSISQPSSPVHSERIIVATTSPTVDLGDAHIVSDEDSDSNGDGMRRTGHENVPNDRFLIRLMSKFTNTESNRVEYPKLMEDANSVLSNEWHDVLDGLNSYPTATVSRDSEDLDDSRDHLVLMKSLSTSDLRSHSRSHSHPLGYKVNIAEDTIGLAPIARNGVSQDYTTSSIYDKVRHVIVSDDEDDFETPRRTLYPDEVEV